MGNIFITRNMRAQDVKLEFDLNEWLDGLPEKYRPAVTENHYLLSQGFFWGVNAYEANDYRAEARNEYNPDKDIDPYWHPVMVDECIQIIKEFIND
jgi:hypothetical protein